MTRSVHEEVGAPEDLLGAGRSGQSQRVGGVTRSLDGGNGAGALIAAMSVVYAARSIFSGKTCTQAK